MAPSHISLKRTLLVTTVITLSTFSAVGFAQGDNNRPTTQVTTGGNAKTTAVADTKTNTNANAAPTRTTQKEQTSSSTNLPKIETDKSESSSSKTTEALPGLKSTTTTQGRGGKLTGLPTLSKTVDNTVPTYPPPSPPPVQDAPFMNRSTLPDGTVFIAVGAILGLFAVAILLWRGIVSFLLKRSVERAAMAQHITSDKPSGGLFPAPPAPFYKDYSHLDSTPNLSAPTGGTTGGSQGKRRTNRGPVPSSTPSMTNLFFSPTAAGAASTAGNTSSSANRESRFLPAGFYAATTASPANQGHHQHGPSISLTNLNPARASRVEMTPPESPNLFPRNAPPAPGLGHGYNQSSTSLSLNQSQGGQQRAPSAFLEDMLDDQPEAFPPQGMTPREQQNGQGQGHYRGGSNRF